MGSRVVILQEAANEYEQIVRYLADHLRSPQAASAFMDEFDRKVELIGENPEASPLSRMPELARHGYRRIAVCHHLVLYKAEPGTVYLAHVFHQSQDYARLV